MICTMAQISFKSLPGPRGHIHVPTFFPTKETWSHTSTTPALSVSTALLDSSWRRWSSYLLVGWTASLVYPGRTPPLPTAIPHRSSSPQGDTPESGSTRLTSSRELRAQFFLRYYWVPPVRPSTGSIMGNCPSSVGLGISCVTGFPGPNRPWPYVIPTLHFSENDTQVAASCIKNLCCALIISNRTFNH